VRPAHPGTVNVPSVVCAPVVEVRPPLGPRLGSRRFAGGTPFVGPGANKDSNIASRRLVVTVTAEPIVRPRLLLVEDEDAIVVPLVEGLEREGFEVTTVRTGGAALRAAGDADLVLLDLGLPDVDGADVCRTLRRSSDTPIIVLTARGDEFDRVLLLELGADDYVVKPFGFRELVARIRAVRRRTHRPDSTASAGSGVQQIGALRIDRRARRVTIDENEIALTPKEFDLLARLADDSGTVVRREQLIEEVWDEHWWGPTKTLDVHIASLRKKLADPTWIATVRSVGYRLDVAH
jgi:two-component system, OmpR family, response regulator RegX3